MERSFPESLSPALMRAQARLENDELESGLAVLDSVVRAARKRGRDPLWLERQRHVRTDGRFRYFECEWELLAEGAVRPTTLGSVGTDDTTFAQDGRVAELRAGVYGSGDEWAAALDEAASAYSSAESFPTAARLARKVFEAQPTPARAYALAYATYNATYSSTADAITDPVPTLRFAIEALEGTLPAWSQEEFRRFVGILAPMRARLVEFVERDRTATGVEALPWAFVSAIVNSDDWISQLTLEWLLNSAVASQAASFAIVEYAASLQPSLPLEQRLVVRINLFGSDSEVYNLVKVAAQHFATADNESDRLSQTQWLNGVRLYLALLDGDHRRMRQLSRSDLAQSDWILHVKGLAGIELDGVDASRPLLHSIRTALRRGRGSKLIQAWVAAALGDEDEVSALDQPSRSGGQREASRHRPRPVDARLCPSPRPPPPRRGPRPGRPGVLPRAGHVAATGDGALAGQDHR